MSDQTSNVAEAMALGDHNPGDVEAQLAAAYACDRYGSELDAVRYYDAAWSLGVPDAERRRFMVGYGSTLRNVGRVSESVAVLRQAVSESPEFAPNHAFLALSLHSEGAYDEALAAALTAVIAAGADNLDGYDRALSYYKDTLLGR